MLLFNQLFPAAAAGQAEAGAAAAPAKDAKDKADPNAAAPAADAKKRRSGGSGQAPAAPAAAGRFAGSGCEHVPTQFVDARLARSRTAAIGCWSRSPTRARRSCAPRWPARDSRSGRLERLPGRAGIEERAGRRASASRRRGHAGGQRPKIEAGDVIVGVGNPQTTAIKTADDLDGGACGNEARSGVHAASSARRQRPAADYGAAHAAAVRGGAAGDRKLPDARSRAAEGFCRSAVVLVDAGRRSTASR